MSRNASPSPQRPARLSPPPPLDRMALAGMAGPASVSDIRNAIGTGPSQPTKPSRGVALAVLNRLLQPQTSNRAREAAGRQTPLNPAAVLSPSPSYHADEEEKTPTNGAAGSSSATKTAASASATQSTKDALQAEESDAEVKAAKDEGKTAEKTTTSGHTEEALPWWRRILIDQHYRQRLMQLSTEAYRKELKLLQDSPAAISGAAGMEQRKVWRERQWWTDDLADAGTSSHSRVARDSPQSYPNEGVKEASNGAEGPACAPLKEEVEETVVMAQHVAFQLPRHRTLAETFAQHHPRAMIRVSGLETIRRVALGAKPPVQYAHELEEQEAAVDAHLSTQRRLSLEVSHSAKQRLAQDILAGREEVPMQTAITDDVFGGADAKRVPPQGKRQELASGRGAPLRRGDGKGTVDSDDAAVSVPVALKGSKSRPTTPPRIRDRLPPGNHAILEAQHEVNVAAIIIRSSALASSAMPVKGLSSALGESAKQCRSSGSTTTTQQEQERSLKVSEMSRAAMYAQQQQLRCQEAAAACTDGTENLYGFQYVWRLPLPPSGFIRVVPDPRYAMWPDDTLHEAEKDTLALDGVAAGGGRGAMRRSQFGTTRGSGGTAAASSHHRQREMRRLARRVNNRTRKLRWLHEIGRRRACYNDLEFLTDSDTSSLSSSFGAGSQIDQSGDANGGEVRGWNPKSPSRYSLNVVRQMERKKRGVVTDKVAERRRSVFRRVAAANETAEPRYDGPLNVNIYADVPDRKKLRESLSRATGRNVAESLFDGTATMCTTAEGKRSTAPTRRVFLGCYRQSRLLIHYKMYCRALHEEAQIRCGPPLTHVTESGAGHHHGGRESPDATPFFPFDEATSALLRGVPIIPYPVLRLQAQPPALQQPHARNTPVLSTVSEARCWEGLFPSAKVDLTEASHHTWRALRESGLVQQALRDIFEDLPHDKEGLLDKRTFVLFVLQLLELFFPTHLGATTHIAIAEEEWVYRGTSEHVGPRTFHEKFFGFPFIFLRDIEAVTETQLVEFWTILRVCLRAQQEQRRRRRHDEPAATPEDFLAALHLLVPLSGFTSAQLRGLITSPPPAFDPVVYDRFRLLTEAYRSDPVVRDTPRTHQHAVARARVEQRLRALPTQQALSEEAKVVTCSGITTSPATAALPTVAGPSASIDITLRSLPTLLSGSVGMASRSGAENIVQREREEQRRCAEAQEKRALLGKSILYQRKQQLLHERAAATLSGIECATSSWELHRGDVYEPPSQGGGEGRTVPTVAAAGLSEKEDGVEDVEDALLEYLDNVPADVFNGRVSLRERYLLHTGYQHRRQEHTFPWMLHRAPDEVHPASSTAPASFAAESNTIRAPNTAKEAKTRRFLRVMKGEGDNVAERQHVVAAECQRLLSLPVPPSDAAESHRSATTTSFASGMYPLRPVPRTISSIVTTFNRRARACILEQHEYDPSYVSGQDGRDTGSYLRRESEATAAGAAERHAAASTRPARRTPSRLRAKVALASFYTARDLHARSRSFHRSLALEHKSSVSAIAPAAAPLTAALAHRGSRTASGLNVKHKSNKTLRPLSRLPVPVPVQAAEDVSTAAAVVPLTATSPTSTPERSRSPLSVSSTPRKPEVRAGRPGGQVGPTLARPITTVAFLEASAEDGNADEEKSVLTASVLLDSARSIVYGHSGHGSSNASFSGTALNTGGNGAGGAQERLGTTSHTTPLTTHYAERLRARQGRQQRYQQRFNATGRPAGTMKR